MNTKFLRPAILTGSLLLPLPSMAASLVATSSTDGMNDSDTSNTVNVSSSVSGSNTISTAQSSAGQNGALYALSDVYDDGTGAVYANAGASWSENVTNTSGSAQNYTLNFSTGSGNIFFNSHANLDNGLLSTSGASAINYSVIVNSVPVWSSYIEIAENPGPLMGTSPNQTRSTYEFTQDGYDLNGTLSLGEWTETDYPGYTGGSYKYDAQLVSLDLGTLLDGESLDVVYALYSNTTGVNFGSNKAGTGSWAEVVSAETPVPVPAALPLFLSGIAGLMAFGRHNKKA